MRRYFRAFQALAVLFFCMIAEGGAGLAAAPSEPLPQMKATVDDILVILRNEQLPVGQKKERVLREVEKRFDFEEMSKLTLARYWREISSEEQERFVALFSQLLENNYISRVEGYSGEEVIFKEQAVRDNKAVVSSIVLQQQSKTEIPINYRMKNENGKWMVYDVMIEGVSLVRNYRSQFRSILDREDFAGLLKRIEEKIQEQKEAT